MTGSSRRRFRRDGERSSSAASLGSSSVGSAAAKWPAPPSKLRKTVVLVLTAGVVATVAGLVDARWANLPDLPGTVVRYLDLMTQGVAHNPLEDPTSGYWEAALRLMTESLQMAWIGTLMGAVLSFPLGFLAAENVVSRPVAFVVRQVLNVIRAIPELVFAVAVMLPIFGLGPLAGALALGIGSVGSLGKLTAEVVEGIDPGPVEAVRATGARTLQVFRAAVVPQALPETVAFWLYRFEINIRASAILGFLGAGGIGSLLSTLFERRIWDRIGITLLVIIVVTIVVDAVSARVRRRIIAGAPHRLAHVTESSILPAAG